LRTVKLLLVTRHFPPSSGGGVHRPLKFATHLPALGIETHVLAPDVADPAPEDAELELPTQAWIHRVRYVGPRAGRPSERLLAKQGVARLGTQAALLGRKLLVPDENVPWSTFALPVAIRLVRREGIDVVLTTSPPPSLHLLGAAVKRTTGAAWVADLRDPLTAHPHRRGYESQLARVKERAVGGVGRLVASQADAIVAASDAIAEEMRGLEPKAKVVTIANGCDFDDFAGLEHHASDRLRITHAGHFHGKRDPKPFLRALAGSGLDDVVARFAGDFRAADREYAEALGLGDRIEVLGNVSRRRSLELQRDSEALLLLIPESGGRERGVLTGKIFEYLAAERPILAAVPPDGAAARLVRDTGAGIVVPPGDEDALRKALLDLHRRWQAGSLDGTPLSAEWRSRLSRSERVEELADVLRSVA
jgi:glycosyltransferase involved in cell wall biosynthesis